ncbi:uncharacterized protein SPPG_02696 [Spizellomyces punctatus DAOM BR117]|uniref:Uncharacterized protein n=1 Tax=Spizellomyces punctatus (strain DAOM BR117) TaxID=645134 RepID=A0A0L0HL99_SPIPD|nr:uncharacterized protein SPPG_02696 [Spizellomyces punctatus DAOM BR117]KND02211.1 hypothetical protein SPPG_02696 [Spizellomyces punctatus DAOM BR117]|eukprot:XP_016610250.1 hypothetical protein SPPG_02696 [Spizellomyces punctatus DAOM BR117]
MHGTDCPKKVLPPCHGDSSPILPYQGAGLGCTERIRSSSANCRRSQSAAAVKYHDGQSRGSQSPEDPNDDNDGRPTIAPNTENSSMPGIPDQDSDSGPNTTILGVVGGSLAAISGIGIVVGIRMAKRRRTASSATSPAEDSSTKPPSPISNNPPHQSNSPDHLRESVPSIALDIDDLSELVANISRPTTTRPEFSYLAATLVPAPPFPTAAYGNNKTLKTEPKNWISKSLDKRQFPSLHRTLSVKSSSDSLNRPSHTATASNSLKRADTIPPLPSVRPIITSRPNTLNRQTPNVNPNPPTSLTPAPSERNRQPPNVKPNPSTSLSPAQSKGPSADVPESRAVTRTTSTKTPQTLIPKLARSNTIPAHKSPPTGSAHSLGALSEISESENFFSYISRER